LRVGYSYTHILIYSYTHIILQKSNYECNIMVIIKPYCIKSIFIWRCDAFK